MSGKQLQGTTRRPALPEGSTESGTGGDELHRYWSIVWGRRLSVLAVFAVVLGAAWVALERQQPVYRATGMLEIRHPGDEVVAVDALFQLPRISDQHLETQYALLRSPVLARRVAAELAADDGLDLDTRTRWVQAGLLVDPLRGSRLVRVGFDAYDPVLAARTVNSVLRHYSAMRMEAAHGATEKLAAQADSARARLDEAERRLQEFVRANGLLFADGRPGGDSENIEHERLRRLQQELTEAEAERYRRQVDFELVAENGSFLLDSGIIQSLNVRIADLRSEYARLRSTFTDEYPRTRQVREQLDELEALLMREQSRLLSQLENDFRSAAGRESRLREAYAEQRGLVGGLGSRTAEYQVLRREAEGHLQLYAALQQRRNEADVSAAMAATEVAVVESAVVPAGPIRPVPSRDLPLAAIVGLGLGLAFAFLREYTDTSVRTAEQLESLSDVPLLAMIPSSRALERRRAGNGDEVQRHLVEAFGGLRTSVLFDVQRPPPRSLLVTSSHPREGKSTVSMNLAISLAKLGRSVLLIDADTRRPSLHRAFELPPEPGLVTFLGGQGAWRESVRRGVSDGLDLLLAGESTERAVDMLSSHRMRQLVQEAEVEYDFVILDSPALRINAADARTLTPLVDGVVLVVRSGATSRESLRAVVRQTPNVIGVVLNDLDVRSFTAYYGAYGDDRPRTGRVAQGA